jgi:hypothetical protein
MSIEIQTAGFSKATVPHSRKRSRLSDLFFDAGSNSYDITSNGKLAGEYLTVKALVVV